MQTHEIPSRLSHASIPTVQLSACSATASQISRGLKARLRAAWMRLAILLLDLLDCVCVLFIPSDDGAGIPVTSFAELAQVFAREERISERAESTALPVRTLARAATATSGVDGLRQNYLTEAPFIAASVEGGKTSCELDV